MRVYVKPDYDIDIYNSIKRQRKLCMDRTDNNKTNFMALLSRSTSNRICFLF